MIKIIALITMLIDHTGAIIFPKLIILRIIGRIAFPLFAYSLVEGYIHTSNREKYFKRLVIFAITSQIPFSLIYPGILNIGFTLILAFIALLVIDLIKVNKKNMLNYTSLVMILIIANAVNVDYGAYGVLIVLLLYVFKDNLKLCSVFLFIISLQNTIQLYMLVAIPLIVYFNDTYKFKSIKLPKQVYYYFYPIHLIVLYVIQSIIK